MGCGFFILRYVVWGVDGGEGTCTCRRSAEFQNSQNLALAEKDEVIEEKNKALMQKDDELRKKDEEIMELRRRLVREARDDAGVAWAE